MDIDIGIYVTMHISSVGMYVQAIVRIPTAAHASHGIYMLCCQNEFEEPVC